MFLPLHQGWLTSPGLTSHIGHASLVISTISSYGHGSVHIRSKLEQSVPGQANCRLNFQIRGSYASKRPGESHHHFSARHSKNVPHNSVKQSLTAQTDILWAYLHPVPPRYSPYPDAAMQSRYCPVPCMNELFSPRTPRASACSEYRL